MDEFDRGKNTGSEARHGSHARGEGRGTSRLDDISPEAGERIEEIREHLDEYFERAVDFVRQRPATSILVAAGIGYLVGRMVRS